MAEPLLPRPPRLAPEDRASSEWDVGARPLEADAKLLAELRETAALAAPIVATNLCEYAPVVIGVAFAGHLGDDKYIDAVAMGTTFFNVTGLSVAFGLNTALDTLCPQAQGAGREKLVGVYLQRGLWVFLLACAPIFAVNWMAGDILRALGQPEDVAALAGVFARYLLLNLPGVVLYDILRKALQARSVVLPMLVIAVVCDAIMVVTCYVLIVERGGGYLSVAVARTACYTAGLVLLLAYVALSGEGARFWGGWSRRGARRLGEYVRLGVPGMLQMCLEWWAFEAILVISGYMRDSHTAIGAMSICFSITSMTYMVYLGVSIAAAVRIGNHLGAGRGRAARRATALAFALVLAPAALVASGLLVGRRAIASLFTTDADIRAAVARATLALGAYQLLDAANCAAGGVLRASGRQLVGAVSGLVAFYVVGLPLGYVLGFRAGLWVSGLWWAMVAGLTCACATNGGTVALTDWGAQVEAARARLAAEEGRAEADGKGDEDEDEDEEARAPALTPLEPAA